MVAEIRIRRCGWFMHHAAASGGCRCCGDRESSTVRTGERIVEDLRTIEAIDDARNVHRVSDLPEVLFHQFTNIAVTPIRRDDALLGVITLS